MRNEMKYALVTGYATNIGKSITKKLLENDYCVIGTYHKATFSYDQEMRKCYPSIISYEADFTNPDSLSNLIAELKKYEFDVIVNNAGKINLNDDETILNEFESFDYQRFSEVMLCNFDAPLRLCLELKRSIKRGGSIINIASGGGMRATYGSLSYAASKAALINLTKSLSNSFYPYNHIRVNSISPGWVNPDDESSMGVNINSPGAKASCLTPMKRNASTNEIANVVFFLTTAESSFINGANIVVDGGWLNHNIIYYEEAYGRSPFN